MKFAKLLCPLLANTEAFGDTDKSSIGIPKIGEDLTVSCEGTLLSMTLIYPKIVILNVLDIFHFTCFLSITTKSCL